MVTLPCGVPPASHLPVLLKATFETLRSIGRSRKPMKTSQAQSDITESASAMTTVPRGVSVVTSISLRHRTAASGFSWCGASCVRAGFRAHWEPFIFRAMPWRVHSSRSAALTPSTPAIPEVAPRSAGCGCVAPGAAPPPSRLPKGRPPRRAVPRCCPPASPAACPLPPSFPIPC